VKILGFQAIFQQWWNMSAVAFRWSWCINSYLKHVQDLELLFLIKGVQKAWHFCVDFM
jgi:hypothetical protein